MKTCKELGYKKGDKFRVVKDLRGSGGNMLLKDSIVYLHYDDGTSSPNFEFRPREIGSDIGHWWIPLSDVVCLSNGLDNKYVRTIQGVDIDIYDVLKAWEVTCPATQHAIKKLLMPGQRGHKDKLNDLEEAHSAIQRAIELEAF